MNLRYDSRRVDDVAAEKAALLAMSDRELERSLTAFLAVL